MKVSLLKSLGCRRHACGYCRVTASAQEVTGAGATFPAPVYAKWADAYNKATGVRINYQSVGSGAGMRQIRGKTVDFGASDVPLTDAELAKDGLIQFPTVIGGVVPVVNIKGIAPGQLKLTGAGAGRHLPRQDHQVERSGDRRAESRRAAARRRDCRRASRRRFGHQVHLHQLPVEGEPDWKAKVGEGTAVNWPTGAGGKGNEGVSAFVQRLPNSIGYVEYAYAKQNKMTYVQMRNAAGNFVAPSDASFKAAAAGADWSKSFNQVLTDQPGKDSWPITGATFIMMHAKQDKPQQAAAALKFFDWAYTNGDKMADELDYVPMPDAVKALSAQQWRKITDGSGKPVAFK